MSRLTLRASLVPASQLDFADDDNTDSRKCSWNLDVKLFGMSRGDLGQAQLPTPGYPSCFSLSFLHRVRLCSRRQMSDIWVVRLLYLLPSFMQLQSLASVRAKLAVHLVQICKPYLAEITHRRAF
jgi:hypothetical protein